MKTRFDKENTPSENIQRCRYLGTWMSNWVNADKN